MALRDDELRRLLTRRAVVVGLAALAIAIVAVGVVALRSPGYVESRQAVNLPVAVSCPAPGDCMLVDNQGNALSYHSGVWSRPRAITDTATNAISCADESACTAVDIAGSAITLRKSRWTPRELDPRSANDLTPTGLRGIDTVSCPTVTFCLAGDVYGRVYRFNGRSWSRSTALAARVGTIAGIVDISCASPSFCAAVTSGSALTYVGGTWSNPVELEPVLQQRAAAGRHLSALSGIGCSGAICVAVDTFGNAFMLRGGVWSAPEAVDPRSSDDGTRDGLTAVTCATPRFCMATDDLGNVAAFDNNLWSPPMQIDRTDLGLAAISCPTPTFCLALNHLGQALVFDGTHWSPPRTVDVVAPSGLAYRAG